MNARLTTANGFNEQVYGEGLTVHKPSTCISEQGYEVAHVHQEGPQVEVVKLDKHSIEQSCAEPISFPDGVDRFLLVPVECPEGIYEKRIIVPAYYAVHCVKEHKYPYRGGTKICLTWNFFLSGCEELVLPQHYNVKEDVRRTPKYRNHWLMFAEGKHPRACRLQYMSPRIFLQKTAVVLVRAACPRFPDGSPMPELCSYPIVDYVKEVTKNERPTS